MDTEQWDKIQAKRARNKYFRDLEHAAVVAAKKPARAPKKPRRVKPTPTTTDATGSRRGRKGATRFDGTLLCAGTCGRPLRGTGTLASALPGSVKVHIDDKCKACTAHPVTVTITPCRGCAHPMRPSHTTLANHPGTRVHGGQGLCHTCRRRLQPDGTVRPPKTRTDAHDGTTTCIDCHRTLRSSRVKHADRPGTVPVRFHLAEGYVCIGCAKKRART